MKKREYEMCLILHKSLQGFTVVLVVALSMCDTKEWMPVPLKVVLPR